MRDLGAPLDAIGAHRGHLFPFAPVFFGAGIGIYFGLRHEPGPGTYAALVAAALVLAGLWLRGPERWQPIAAAAMLVAAGVPAAGLRAHLVASPVLAGRYYGPVEGRIVAIDRSQSDHVRLTLDEVRMDRPRGGTPARVRVALHGDQPWVAPEPGLRIMATANLGPPEGPVEPGGFDFQRMAWFDRLGALGYTRTPVLVVEPAAETAGLAVDRLRARITRAVTARIPGDPGAFAAAILTGDRSALSRQALTDLRNANTAHLLAISGLHMGLLTGLIFAAVRSGLAFIPAVALRLPVKKIAAGVALGAAAFYLALSGGNVATERAFVMVAVMLVAVLADRRAISLRSVAIAALILLAWLPECLVEPGFQMSFAATTALVATFTGITRWQRDRAPMPRWAAGLFTLVVSSAVAGAATAPVAAAHFNRLADYGLGANLASVPLMGTVVMPAAIAAGVLSVVGLEGWALAVMELGVRWILFVAHLVGSLPGAVTPVPSPPPGVLAVFAGAGLWLLLWRGPARWAGAAGVLAAFVLWSGGTRPLVLVAESGGLVGVLGPEGRALSKPKGDGFAASTWLENDGDLGIAADAALRPGFTGPPGARRFLVGATPGVVVTGRGAADAAAKACTRGRIVVTSVEGPPEPRCTLIDPASLARSGALAITADHRGIHVAGVNDSRGTRLWTRRPRPAPKAPAPDEGKARVLSQL